MIRFVISLLILMVMASCNGLDKKVRDLKLVNIYEVKTNGEFEPSGLTYWDGYFYTVSDKHPYIYRLQLNDKFVELQPYLQIKNENGDKLDFEGITHDDKYFYLISERQFKIFKIAKDGSEQTHIPNDESIKISGQQAGLFQVENAYLEGVCNLNDGHFLLAAERQPRGLLEIKIEGNKVDVQSAYQLNSSSQSSFKNRSVDFSGLSCDEDIYVLERNNYSLTELTKRSGQYKLGRSWRYQAFMQDPDYQFENMEYGHSEGLVVRGDRVYMILDNNKSPFKNGRNNNSLFLELTK